MSREFSVVIERDEEGYFVASVPALPGCHTQARSLDELVERVCEAIILCLKVKSEEGGGLEFVGAFLALTVVDKPNSVANGMPHMDTIVEREEDSFPVPGTGAWGIMNRRRAELIHKKNRGGLSSDELREYEKLQRLSQAALERAFPAPTSLDEELARIEARLASKPGDNVE